MDLATMFLAVPEVAIAMGVRRQSVHELAQKWPGKRKRQGVKGFEFPIASMPPHYQKRCVEFWERKEAKRLQQLAERVRDQVDKDDRNKNENEIADVSGVELVRARVQGLDEVRVGRGAWSQERRVTLNARAVPVADCRLDLVRCMADFVAEAMARDPHLKKRCAEDVFERRYNAGVIQPHLPESRSLYPKVSRASIKRWEKCLKDDGYGGLRDGRSGGRPFRIEGDRRLLDFMTGMLVLRPWIGKALMGEALRAHFPERQDLPSVSTIDRWMKRMRERVGFVAATQPAKFKNSFRVAFGSYSEGVNKPNGLWELDSTPADVLLKEGRFHVLGCVDVFSRRAMVVVSKTSRAIAIALLLRKCLLEWGVPEVVKTDNGKDFVSLHVTRVLADLGVVHRTCLPFQPWQKPHIERFFRTFSHGLLELLPGFVGHNVAERMAIRDRAEFGERLFKKDSVLVLEEEGAKLSAKEFQGFCDRWLEGVYLHQPHWGLEGESPWVRWNSYQGRLRVISDVRGLDVLLAPTSGNGIRRVGKQGLRVEGVVFMSPLLVDCIGERVQVRFDPADLGVVYVFRLDGNFVCEAVCPERLGVSRAEMAAAATKLQRQKVGKERRQLRDAARKVKSIDVVGEVLEGRSRQSEKLIALPREGVEFESPALTEAGKAAIAGEVAKNQPNQTQTQTQNNQFQNNSIPEFNAPETLLGDRVRSLWLADQTNQISVQDLRLIEQFCFSGDQRAAMRFRLAFFGRDECDQFFEWVVPVLRGLPEVRSG